MELFHIRTAWDFFSPFVGSCPQTRRGGGSWKLASSHNERVKPEMYPLCSNLVYSTLCAFRMPPEPAAA